MVDITIGPSGPSLSRCVAVQGRAQMGAHGVFRSERERECVCVRPRMVFVCTWGLLICRYWCECAGLGS